MDILENFGVQPVLLIAQVINFIILLLILKRFLYKPILNALEKRKQKIAESLKNAEEIEQKLALTIEEREKKLAKASEEARALIEEATQAATQIVKDAHEKAALDSEKLLEKSKAQLQMEKELMRQEVRRELVNLVGISLEKVVGKAVSSKNQKELIEQSIKGFE